MVAGMIVFAMCVAAALAGGLPAAKYPAGVNPHACPNYPYCDNVALAIHGAAGHHAVAPYAAPAYAAYGQHAAAAKYPAGVDPHTCPNYPYCDNVVLAAHGAGAAAHGWAGAYGGWAGHAYAAPVLAHGAAHVLGAHAAHGGVRYPAGVSPHACPNYPYCH